ncbi:GP88 family protein [Amycolatopsis sp. lyj-112]|uniref:GP88 family protein n=1 Tax=Amycolatopsis sp. lyj-112 TaxID=2789288 RepID=UPI00397CF8F1
MTLLRQNRELKKLGVWNWSLPAFAGKLPDGRSYNTCPSAGVCAQACYARNGTYLFPNVKARHQQNLMLVLDDLPGWTKAMLDELSHKKFTDAWVRIHDSGDFFTNTYLAAWLEVIRARPRTRFYAYTKEVAMFRTLVEPSPPRNFWWVYSYGGTQDHTLDPAADRVADVFADESSIEDAGWHSQAESDLLAVLGPAPVGIPANNIAHFKARQAGRRWSDWQAGAEAARAGRRERAEDAATRTSRRVPTTRQRLQIHARPASGFWDWTRAV